MKGEKTKGFLNRSRRPFCSTTEMLTVGVSAERLRAAVVLRTPFCTGGDWSIVNVGMGKFLAKKWD